MARIDDQYLMSGRALMFCSFCGHQARVANAVFCARCGAALESTPEPVANMVVAGQTAPPPPPAPAASDELTTARPLLAAAAAGTAPQAQTGGSAAADHARWAHVVLWGGLCILAAIPAGNSDVRIDGFSWWGGFSFPMLGMLSDSTTTLLITLVGVAVFGAAAALITTSTASRWWSIAVIGSFFVAIAVVSYASDTRYDGYEHSLGDRDWLIIAAPAVFFSAWLVLRHRRGTAFVLIPLVLAVQIFATVTIARVAYEVLPGTDLFLIYVQLQPMLIAGLFGLIAARWFRARPRSALQSGSTQSAHAPFQAHPADYAPQNTLAIIGFILSFFVAIAGIVCSHIALSQIKRTGERGRGIAIAGLAIGYTFLALTIAFYLFLFSAVSSLN